MTQNTITVSKELVKLCLKKRNQPPLQKKKKKLEKNDLLILQGQKSGINIQYLLQRVHKHAVPAVLTQ